MKQQIQLTILGILFVDVMQSEPCFLFSFSQIFHEWKLLGKPTQSKGSLTVFREYMTNLRITNFLRYPYGPLEIVVAAHVLSTGGFIPE